MGLLINLLDDISKQQYVEKGKNYLNCTKQGITSEEYRIPNNAKDSATYLWGNLLQTKPCDDMHTFIVTFIPQNCLNSVVRVRFSNHPCGPLSNWKKYETIGEPNKRIDIYFYNGKDSNIPTDSNENNLINNAHLYSDEDIAKLCMALSNLFLNGTFVHPFISQQPIQENNKQINTNKNIMKINESQLRKIIKESIKNTLNEMDFFDNANTKPQKEMSIWPETGDINIGGQLDMRKVMDFIQKNGLNGQTSFNFNNGRIITSLYAEGDKVESCLEIYPIEEWNDYNGMKCIQRRGMKNTYMFYINGIIYFVTTQFN